MNQAARQARINAAIVEHCFEPRHVPARIQAPNWRLPAGAIYVDHPGPFGNPFIPGQTTPDTWPEPFANVPVTDPRHAYALLWDYLFTRPAHPDWAGSGLDYPSDQEIRDTLHGRTLACTCKTASRVCHAELLRHRANPPRRKVTYRKGDGRTHLRILPRVEGFPCCDCGVPTYYLGEHYVVHDHVRAQAGMTCTRGHLCIGCLEQRLGRQLTTEDFTDCPLNDLTDQQRYRSARLIDRLTHTAGST